MLLSGQVPTDGLSTRLWEFSSKPLNSPYTEHEPCWFIVHCPHTTCYKRKCTLLNDTTNQFKIITLIERERENNLLWHYSTQFGGDCYSFKKRQTFLHSSRGNHSHFSIKGKEDSFGSRWHGSKNNGNTAMPHVYNYKYMLSPDLFLSKVGQLQAFGYLWEILEIKAAHLSY